MGEIDFLTILRSLQIRSEPPFTTEGFNLPISALPKQYIDGTLRVDGGRRCHLEYTKVQGRGGYGLVYLGKRKDCSGATVDVCIKISHISKHSLGPEALIQSLAYVALQRAGIHGAVPKVYDIFQYAGDIRFSMSFIQGTRSIDYILESSDPEIALLQILAQVSLILAFLEDTIHLDHRDLKADNIWIRYVPVTYSLRIGDKLWRLQAPFQVVLLDFGFSCLGNTENHAVVSLSDGILPLVDPCPKEGRDLFQFLSSLWSIPQIRAAIGPILAADIELLLSYKNKPYSNLVTRATDVHWVYLLVSDRQFHHPPLHPISLLEHMSIKYPQLKIQRE
jgi:serine/threonine protein kinase